MIVPVSRAGHLRALAALMFGACMLGLGSTLVRLSQAGPAATGFWRLALALPLLALWACRSRSAVFARPAALAVVAGLMFALDIALWHYAVVRTSLVNANVLGNLTPIVVTLFAWLILRQRPKVLFVAALSLAVGGSWLLARPADALAGQALAADRSAGDLFAVASCIWYALYLLAIGVARRSDTTVKVMFWSTLAAAPIMLSIAMILQEPLVPAGPAGWVACGGLGIIHVAGQGSIAWALGRLPPATASIVVLVQPVVAAAFGWLVFSETLRPLQMMGAGLVLSGIVLALSAARK